MPTLYDPLKLGPLTLKNRVIMAPLTRSRSGDARVPDALVAEYYQQRATAGMILSEATSVTPIPCSSATRAAASSMVPNRPLSLK